MKQVKEIWAALVARLPPLSGVWSWFVAGLDAVRKSFSEAFSMKTVWAALITTFVGAFIVGYVAGEIDRPKATPALPALGLLAPTPDAIATAVKQAEDKWGRDLKAEQDRSRNLSAELTKANDALKLLQRRLAEKAAPPKKAAPAPTPAALFPQKD